MSLVVVELEFKMKQKVSRLPPGWFSLLQWSQYYHYAVLSEKGLWLYHVETPILVQSPIFSNISLVCTLMGDLFGISVALSLDALVM